jgi:hypothetical protein
VGVLPAHFNFDWKKLWDRTRARKESTLIWLMWHHGVVVNAWRHSINAEFNGDCSLCHPQVEESILHRFWHCPSACRIWDWATSLLHKLQTRRTHFGPWPALEMTKLIFTKELPTRLQRFKDIWALLKGTCLWGMWTQRNEKVFANTI